MRSILTLLILLSAGFTVAQEPAPTPEPEYTITILVTDPAGKTEFSQSAILPESLLATMVAACETVAKANNLGTVNPNYDPMKPTVDDTNRPSIPFAGSAAIAAAVHKWLAEISISIDAEVKKEAARANAVEDMQRKIGKIKIRNNKPATATVPLR